MMYWGPKGKTDRLISPKHLQLAAVPMNEPFVGIDIIPDSFFLRRTESGVLKMLGKRNISEASDSGCTF